MDRDRWEANWTIRDGNVGCVNGLIWTHGANNTEISRYGNWNHKDMNAR